MPPVYGQPSPASIFPLGGTPFLGPSRILGDGDRLYQVKIAPMHIPNTLSRAGRLIQGICRMAGTLEGARGKAGTGCLLRHARCPAGSDRRESEIKALMLTVSRS